LFLVLATDSHMDLEAEERHPAGVTKAGVPPVRS
jgi:hypothetical protein